MAHEATGIDERELVRACLRGDACATHRLVARFQRDVYAVCLRLLGHVQDAEDVTQEVFLRVFRSLRSWDANRPLRPWVLAIAVNRCRTWLRKRTYVAPLQETLCIAKTCADHDGTWELQEALQDALAQLREEYRVVFVLYHDRHFAYEEIAEVLGRPVGTIKTWLHRARIDLLEYLRQRGWADDLPTDMPRVPHLDTSTAGR